MALTMLDKKPVAAKATAWPPEIAAEFEREQKQPNGCVGQRLLSETERVRVWEIKLKPGERFGFHRHVLDYFWSVSTDGLARAHINDGTTVEHTYIAGETRHETHEPGHYKVHDLENIGSTDLNFITVEFLDSANKPLPVPDKVRVWGLCFSPLSRLGGGGGGGGALSKRSTRGKSPSPAPPSLRYGGSTSPRKRGEVKRCGGIGTVDFPIDLVLNALVAGLLLGAFYAAVTVGVSISFGILDIVNIAHPAFIILGSYIAYIVNTRLGVDPILASIIMLPAFYALGALVYQVYYASFEKYGQESLRGLAFFFGLLFVTEVTLILVFGVDYRYVEAAYIGPSLHVGVVDLPLRMLVPCLVALGLFGALQLFLSRTFIGRAIMAVAQDQLALQLMGASPMRIKRIAFAISIGTASVAGALLIIIQPVEPSVGREYIGRVFAICVFGGLGSLPGALIGAMLLGIIESFTSTFYGPSWSPAVAFGFLLLTLAFRPAGLFGR